ncbi:MAG: hypothetical protein KBT68_05470 [bacterium]|nr:hypothetical protein [Candidatus Colisoma equi]
MKKGLCILAALCEAAPVALSAADGIAFDRLYNGGVEQDMTDWTSAMGSALTIAAGKTIGITNGTFTVGSAVSSIGAGASFYALYGSTFTFTGSNKRFGFSADNCLIVADQATLTIAPSGNAQAFFDTGKHCAWVVKNGGKLTNGSSAQSKASRKEIQGTDNRIVVTGGSTLDVSAFNANQTGRQLKFTADTVDCVLAVSNSTLKLNSEAFEINGRTSLVSFHDATVSGSTALTYDAASVSNRVVVSGTEGSFGLTSITMDGASNAFRVEDTPVASAVAVAGSGNRVEMACAGFDLSKFTFSGDNHVLSIEKGGSFQCETSTLPSFGTGVGCVFDINGGTYENTKQFKAPTCEMSIRVRNGGKFACSTLKNSSTRQAIQFTPGTTHDVNLSIEDEGVLEANNSICASGTALVSQYNWTNCPNCSITFSGSNPRFNIQGTDGYIGMTLGTSDEQPLKDAVVLRFNVPEGNFAAAPIQQGGDREIALYGNQPIEVNIPDTWGETSHRKIVIPLIYDHAGFRRPEYNKTLNVPLTPERLQTLKANAKLPEGAYFTVTDETVGKTLNAVIPGNMGLFLIVK